MLAENIGLEYLWADRGSRPNLAGGEGVAAPFPKTRSPPLLAFSSSVLASNEKSWARP